MVIAQFSADLTYLDTDATPTPKKKKRLTYVSIHKYASHLWLPEEVIRRDSEYLASLILASSHSSTQHIGLVGAGKPTAVKVKISSDHITKELSSDRVVAALSTLPTVLG